MNAPEQKKMFREMGVKTFYISECIGDSKRATVMFEAPENVLYNIFISPETKPILLRPLVIFMKKPKSQDG